MKQARGILPRNLKMSVIMKFKFQIRAGETFCGRTTRLTIDFEEILPRGHGNSEEQNKVLEPSRIITN
jgi:hypothetical protein